MSWSWYLIVLFVVVCLFLLLTVVTKDYEYDYRARLEEELQRLAGAMKRIFQRARSVVDDQIKPQVTLGQLHQPGQVPMQDRENSIKPVTPEDVTKYRYHHGCNLGSIFVQERWLTPSMFSDKANGTSELAAAESWITSLGMEGAKQRHERHWREYVSDADLDWLRDGAKCNAVRLPIGYFTLGPPYCEGTAFRDVAPIYEEAWQAVTELVARCHARGIGVLIDLHGLPGGANPGEHSGTNSGKAEFWSSRKSRDLATRCLCFIAQQAAFMPGVLGVQIVNEAEHDARNMYTWYDDVIKELSTIDSSMPIYVSDGWDLVRCATWSQNWNSGGRKHICPVVVDTHIYFCFTPGDAKKSPQQITGEVWSKLHENELKDGSIVDRGASQAIVGEYSCVLGEESWAKGAPEPKDSLVRQFGNALSQRFQLRAGGSFFWTYRMDWMPGGEWGFKQMTESHAIVPPFAMQLPREDVQRRIANAQAQRDHRRGTTWGRHCQYWDSNHPGQYEHQRFVDGWDVGFADAMVFFATRSEQGLGGADTIGMLDLWVLKRFRESGQGGAFVWEWETGMRQGVKDFYALAEVQ